MTATRFVLMTCLVLVVPLLARAELRAFRLKITNTATGTERYVVTRFDHVQYPMYNFVARTETLEIAQTWMCYNRNDYVGVLCPNPADPGAAGAGGVVAPGAPGVMNSGASNPLN